MPSSSEPLPDHFLPEQEPTKPRKRPSTDDAREARDELSFLDGTNGASSLAGDEPTVKLVNLFRFHPFMSLFLHIANARFARRKSARSRVDELIAQSPRLYKWCVVSDFVLTVVLTLLLIVAVTLGIYKTLFSPLVWPF